MHSFGQIYQTHYAFILLKSFAKDPENVSSFDVLDSITGKGAPPPHPPRILRTVFLILFDVRLFDFL